MFSKFEIWQYRDDRNCWDYVREFLIERAGVPAKDVPKFGISPEDKRSMTKASEDVKKTFYDSDPINYAVACHYLRGILIHVGIVFEGRVWHTSKHNGTTKSTIKEFEAMASRTVYKIHGSLRNI